MALVSAGGSGWRLRCPLSFGDCAEVAPEPGGRGRKGEREREKERLKGERMCEVSLPRLHRVNMKPVVAN